MKLGMNRIGGPLDLSAAERSANRVHQEGLSKDLDEKRAVVAEGWGPERVHRKNKWTSWERIDALKDPGTRALPVGTLVNWGREFLGSLFLRKSQNCHGIL